MRFTKNSNYVIATSNNFRAWSVHDENVLQTDGANFVMQ
jgi:hypothetical protein